jgi:hypothetical protein
MSVAIVDTIDIFGTTAGSSILSGLMAYWKLDESSAGSVVDAVGMYPGTATAITYNASGKISRCYNFNGTTSYITMGDNLKPTTSLTVSLWMKSATAATSFLACRTAWDGNWKGYRIMINSDGTAECILGSGNDAVLFDYPFGTGLLNSAWHHLVCTWNGSTVYLYYDNNKSIGYLWPYTLAYVPAQPLIIGSNEQYNASFYTGDLDEVCIFNRAITDAEVLTLFNATPYPFS